MDFELTHGPPTKCRPASGESLDRYQGRLPEVLLDHWREFGWCSYSDGLIWTVDPSDFTSVLEDWSIPADRSFVFARTAFGNLYFWDESGAYSLSVLYQEKYKLAKKIESIFEISFCLDDYIKNVLKKPLFKKALKRFGPLDHDECYGFVPALALGGSEKLDFIKKVKLKEYLSIIAQI